MNREAKELRLLQIWQKLNHADRLIFVHASLTIVGTAKNVPDAMQKMSTEDFEQFYNDCIDNWGTNEGAEK